MLDVLTEPTIQAVLSIVVLCVLIGAGFWLVSSFRDQSYDDRMGADELIPKFEEMRRQGEISDAEFRTIRSALTDNDSRESDCSDVET